MVISYVFKNPGISKDILTMFHFLLIYLDFYIIIGNKFGFLWYIIPYYGFVEFLFLNLLK